MKICGITVCVNYSDHFCRSISRWKDGLNSLVVVSTPDDLETIHLCRSHGVVVYPTDAFTRKGATFNKGSALVETIEMLELLKDADWLLLFDADIVPENNWRQSLEMAEPQSGFLYGAPRHHENGRQIFDRDIAGYFAMFHASDPNAQVKPLFDTHWTHAGNFDTEFQSRWHRGGIDKRRMLPITLMHLGETGTHWFGRCNVAAMQAMMRERQRRGGKYDHERIG